MASTTANNNSNVYLATNSFASTISSSGWGSCCIDTDIHLSDETRDILLETLKEDELEDLLVKVKERNSNVFPTILKDFVSNRHFSEEFLLRHAEYLSKDIISRRHKEHLVSGDYPTLSLLLLTRS